MEDYLVCSGVHSLSPISLQCGCKTFSSDSSNFKVALDQRIMTVNVCKDCGGSPRVGPNKNADKNIVYVEFRCLRWLFTQMMH